MPVEAFTPHHAAWTACAAHLARHKAAHWALDANGAPLPGVHYLGIPHAEAVIGHITLQRQRITIPATQWSTDRDHILRGPDGEPLYELFVLTFAVDEAHRRRGHGRALQSAALDLARQCGCYQVRSWSSLDKPANYALKLSLGFAAHPSTQATAAGYDVSGVYFVKIV